ncbi:hypothetical protein V1264_018726 [Littorina saxatilis]|uniref:SGNH hydrolase-type esterase domain-containing protein n=1 Tax=Littorina saxatilis TaxID=31220 RepID=A0AAN9GD55_9CAEN
MFTSCAVVGHSFTWRFQRFVNTDEGVRPDLGFDGFEQIFDGRGGRKISDVESMLEQNRAIFTRKKWGVIVLMVGDNNIVPGTTPNKVFRELWHLCVRVQTLANSVVVVSGMTQRYSGWGGFNDIAREVNRLLHQQLKTAHRIVGLFPHYVAFPPAEKFAQYQKHFLADGIHLSGSGHMLLYRALRKVLLDSRHIDQ